MNKRGLSDVVVAVIIILLVIAAIAIIWGFVSPALRNSGSQISTSQFTTNLEVPSQYSFDYVSAQHTATFSVERKAGEGDVAGIIVVLTAEDGTTARFDGVATPSSFGTGLTTTSINQLEKKTFTVNLPNTFTTTNPVVKITVAPVLRNAEGTTSIGAEVERKTSAGGSGSSPTSPTASLTANPTTINAGGSSTLTWSSSTNAQSCSASWTTSTATSGTQSVSPASTTTYTITCTGQSGTTPATASAIVTVNSLPSCVGGASNGIIEAGEQCDGSATFTSTCATLSGQTFTAGALKCGSNCQFMTTSGSTDNTGRCFGAPRRMLVTATPSISELPLNVNPGQSERLFFTLSATGSAPLGLNSFELLDDSTGIVLTPTPWNLPALSYTPSSLPFGEDVVKTYNLRINSASGIETIDKIKYRIVSSPIISTYGDAGLNPPPSGPLPRNQPYSSIRVHDTSMTGTARAWYTIGSDNTRYDLVKLDPTIQVNQCPPGSDPNCVRYAIPVDQLTFANFPSGATVTISISAVDAYGAQSGSLLKQLRFA